MVRRISTRLRDAPQDRMSRLWNSDAVSRPKIFVKVWGVSVSAAGLWLKFTETAPGKTGANGSIGPLVAVLLVPLE
jgi:hypothetical protein